MIKFWIIALSIFILVTFILAKLTLKKRREERGEKMWKLHDGMAKYWWRLSLISMAITTFILFTGRWLGVNVLA